MKYCPICNNELIMAYDNYNSSCNSGNHTYQYIIRTKNQIVTFYNENIFSKNVSKNVISFASRDNIFSDCVYLEDFNILKNISYKNAKRIYDKLNVFQ